MLLLLQTLADEWGVESLPDTVRVPQFRWVRLGMSRSTRGRRADRQPRGWERPSYVRRALLAYAPLTLGPPVGHYSDNETSELRWDYGDPQLGTCQETIKGGNHFRYWTQTGGQADR